MLFNVDITIDRLRLALAVAGAAVMWLFTSTLLSWWRLRHVPGPRFAGFSYLWLGSVSTSGKQAYIWQDLMKLYGPIVRIGPNYITTNDHKLIRHISSGRSSYDRDPWYSGGRFNPFDENMFTYLDRHAHDAIKAKTSAGYSGRDTPGLQQAVDEQLQSFVKLIRDEYLSDGVKTKQVDLALILSFFTMDVISSMAFGKPFGYIKENKDLHNFIQTVRESWPKVSFAIDVPWLRSLIYSPLFLRLVGPKYSDEKGFGCLMRVAKQVVDERYNNGDEQAKDMMGSWIRHGLTKKELESEGLFMIVAGSDTSASVMRITMLNVISNPHVYRKLKQVIATSISSGDIGSPISVEQARNIPYLRALIYEGIRIRAPAAGLFLKKVPSGGINTDTLHIPAGTSIGVNIASLFQSKEIFGDDAEFFEPERFLRVSKQGRVEMERVVELAFGHGRFMCAGMPVAFMELNKIYFELFRAFDFQLLRPEKPWDSSSYALFLEENMWVKVTEHSEC